MHWWEKRSWARLEQGIVLGKSPTGRADVLWVAEEMHLVTPSCGYVEKKNDVEIGSSDPAFATGQLVLICSRLEVSEYTRNCSV